MEFGRNEAFDQPELESLHPLHRKRALFDFLRGRRRKCSPPIGTVTTSSARCTPRATRDVLAMWSTRISFPPGRSTRVHFV
jgi:hypothetical protein